MPTLNDELKVITDQLKQQRDEMKVQLHLAKEDAKVEWEKLETQWDQLRIKLKNLSDATEESKKDILNAVHKLTDELKKGYENLKKNF
jgi:putative cell wall-binding protein